MAQAGIAQSGEYKFRIGQRVRISAEGISAGIYQKTGFVQNIDRLDYPVVLWEGRKIPSSYHADFIESGDEP